MAATDRSRTAYTGFLVPDPDINSDTFATDSSFTALYPRPGQPIPSSTTALALAAHGAQSSGTLNILTQQGGIVGPQGASFLWKDSGATDYYGWDAPTVITGWRSLVWATTPAINVLMQSRCSMASASCLARLIAARFRCASRLSVGRYISCARCRASTLNACARSRHWWRTSSAAARLSR